MDHSEVISRLRFLKSFGNFHVRFVSELIFGLKPAVPRHRYPWARMASIRNSKLSIQALPPNRLVSLIVQFPGEIPASEFIIEKVEGSIQVVGQG